MTLQEDNLNNSGSGIMAEWLNSQNSTSADSHQNVADSSAFSELYSEEDSSILNSDRMNAVLHFDEGGGDYTETGADVATGVAFTESEDPHKAKTQRQFHRLPVAKATLIASGTLLILMFISSIFGNIFGQGSGPVVKNPAGKPQTQTKQANVTGQPNGEVLTALALTEQEQQLGALNKKKLKVQKGTAAPPKSAVVPVKTLPKPATPQRRSQTPAPPQPIRASRSFSPPPSPRPAFLNAAPAKPAVAPASTQDPASAWLAAAQAGSFGQASGSTSPTQPSSSNIPARQASIPGQNQFSGNSNFPVRQASIPGQNQFSGSSNFPVRQASISGQNQFSRNNSFPVNQGGASAPNAASEWPSVNSNDEALILAGGQGQAPKSLMVGTSAKGVLATPVAWDASAGNSNQPKRYVVVLKEGLQAADGSVALPEGTQLVAEQSNFNSNGLVELELRAAVVDVNGQSQEINLPQGALQINGKSGKPLFAKSRGGKKSGGGLLGSLGQVALGTIRQASGLLTRPDTTISSSGSNTFFSSSNGSPNLLAGAVQGGSDALLRNVEARAQNALTQPQTSQSPIWYANAGTSLEIYVNQSVPIPGILAVGTQLAEKPAAEKPSPENPEESNTVAESSPVVQQPQVAEQPQVSEKNQVAREPELATPPQNRISVQNLPFASQGPLKMAMEVEDNSMPINPKQQITPSPDFKY